MMINMVQTFWSGKRFLRHENFGGRHFEQYLIAGTLCVKLKSKIYEIRKGKWANMAFATFACGAVILFMSSCSASLTDYGYKGGSIWTNLYSNNGSFTDMGNSAVSSENSIPTVIIKYKDPRPENYKIDCKRYDFPVKKITCKGGDNLEVKSYMIFQFDMENNTYRNFTFQIDFIKAGTTDTVSTAKTSAPFIKGPIKLLRNLTELTCCRKKDKVLYVETKADINPVYFDDSFIKFKKKFMKPMAQEAKK
jgi:hypothetical protein